MPKYLALMNILLQKLNCQNYCVKYTIKDIIIKMGADISKLRTSDDYFK